MKKFEDESEDDHTSHDGNSRNFHKRNFRSSNHSASPSARSGFEDPVGKSKSQIPFSPPIGCFEKYKKAIILGLIFLAVIVTLTLLAFIFKDNILLASEEYITYMRRHKVF